METPMPQAPNQPKRQTTLSACRTYRYTLWREWDNGTFSTLKQIIGQCNYAMFIGLNPSTADETKDDPTIRKCIGFAKRWGYGALCMTNLFAFRATLPRDMKKSEYPVGEDNLHHLLECASSAGIVVAAWGKNGCFQSQDLATADQLSRIGIQLMCLRTNGDGSPEHPLYVPYDTEPKAWSVSVGCKPCGVSVPPKGESVSPALPAAQEEEADLRTKP